MKALFLGNVAADTANGIRDRLPPGLSVEILADPQQLMRSPEAAAECRHPGHQSLARRVPAGAPREAGAIGRHRHRADRPRRLAARRHDLQRLRPRDRDRRIHRDGHAGLEPPASGKSRATFAPAPRGSPAGCRAGRRMARSCGSHGRHRRARPGRARGRAPRRRVRLPHHRGEPQRARAGAGGRAGLSAQRTRPYARRSATTSCCAPRSARRPRG